MLSSRPTFYTFVDVENLVQQYNIMTSNDYICHAQWHGGRVVYRARLESGRPVKGSVGSNPTRAANFIPM